MANLLCDVRYALRTLMRDIRLTALVGAILGLAIGGSTAIFGLIDVVFLRPVGGVVEPGELIRFERVQPGLSATDFSYPDYLAYRDANRSFGGVAAHCRAALGLSASAKQRVRADLVSGNYFAVLAVRATLGRLIAPGDDASPGNAPVAVLSHALWRNAFGANPGIAGKSVTLNGHPFVVIGVADPNFTGTQIGQPVDVWLPLSMQPLVLPELSANILSNRDAGWIDIFARLKRGAKLARAQADVATIAGGLARQYPITNAHRRVRLLAGIGIDPDDQYDLAKLLGLLFAAVAILLVSATANIATLLLARSLGRQREIAVRLAVGGTPARIVRQLVVEALLLASVAGVFGSLLTPGVSILMMHFRESSPLLRGIEPAFDWRLAVFVLFLIAGTGIVLSLAPVLESRRLDLAESLKQASRGATARHSRKQQLLVASQLALSFVLLTATGMMLKTMHGLMSVAPGFDSRNVLLVSTDVGIQGYSESRGQRFYRALRDRIEALPGVRAASFAETIPPQELGSRVSVFHPGQVPPADLARGREFELGLRVDASFVAPHYFRTLGIPLLSGRDFSDQDHEQAAGVAIVNQALAERMWPGEDAVGKQIVWPSFSGPPRAPMRVVGVVGNTRQRSLALDPPMVLYIPVAQSYAPAMTLAVRATQSDSTAMLAAIRKQISVLAKDLPVFRIQTMQEHVRDSLWRQRTALAMIAAFAGLSIVIAVVGLYGVISQWVLQRMRDLGIRMALGATRVDVVKIVLRRGFLLVVTGVTAGVGGILLVACFGPAALAGISYGVRAADPGVIAIVALMLLAIALGCSLIPALRASRADPASTLRAE